jgi:hypothetical protein
MRSRRSAVRLSGPRRTGQTVPSWRQRDKVTQHETQKNGPHSRDIPASGPFSQGVAGVGFDQRRLSRRFTDRRPWSLLMALFPALTCRQYGRVEHEHALHLGQRPLQSLQCRRQELPPPARDYGIRSIGNDHSAMIPAGKSVQARSSNRAPQGPPSAAPLLRRRGDPGLASGY